MTDEAASATLLPMDDSVSEFLGGSARGLGWSAVVLGSTELADEAASKPGSDDGYLDVVADPVVNCKTS